jgi:predicted aspartyl protease
MESITDQLNPFTRRREMTTTKGKIFSDITLQYVTFDKFEITFENLMCG